MGAGVAGPLVESDAVDVAGLRRFEVDADHQSTPPFCDALAGVAELLKMALMTLIVSAVVAAL